MKSLKMILNGWKRRKIIMNKTINIDKDHIIANLKEVYDPEISIGNL